MSDQLILALDCLREGLQIIGPDWRYLYVNEAVCEHGRRTREELLGHKMMDVYPGIESTAMFDALDRCMRDRTSTMLENEFVHSDGARVWFDLRVHPCPGGILILSVDISERKRLERQLRHAQKLEALGQLAAGVAHDFNNVLTAVASFTAFALEGLPDGDPGISDLRQVLAAVERAGGLTKQLLGFARGQGLEPRVLNINERVHEMDSLLRRLLGEDVDIATAMAPDLWSTRVDPGGFEQLIVNLAVNARDAMPDGGRLSIETSNIHVDEDQLLRRGERLSAGDYVLLAVTDTGTGMNADVQERIFDPFFTTKEPGRGTGLGLATCYGIVRSAGGFISVYSEPGHGSVFKVYLPRATGASEQVPAVLVTGRDAGTETVLIVEDDPQVRVAGARALSARGYRVLEAGSAQAALSVVASEEGPLDVLLTDMVLPGKSGLELAQELSAMYPAVRIIYTSGYTHHAMQHRGLVGHAAHMLMKPFTPDSVARKVREVLDSARV